MLAAITLASNSHALDSTSGQHLEITPTHDTATSQWTWTAVGSQIYPLSDVFFSGRDITGASGTRITRATDPKWDFMGVPAGATLWRFRDTIVGTPGFGDTQLSLSQNNLDFRLHSVQGPPGGHVSLYFSNTNPITYFRTDDGIDATDLFPKPANHTHLNWAFTRKGLWIVHLTVQGILNSTGQPTPVSPPQPFVFAIGDFARWKAESFNMAELQNPQVSGDSADPDGDGWTNLQEYALGGDCLTPSSNRTDDALPLAPVLLPPASSGVPWRFSFFRKMTGASEPADITYEVESSPSLSAPSWSPETGVEEILTSDSAWQRVAVPLSASAPRFFRLKIATLP